MDFITVVGDGMHCPPYKSGFLSTAALTKTANMVVMLTCVAVGWVPATAAML